tara:strand:+ start:2233 stop:3003 length:771 start_codon:yes stop_codon:yes gene_type:complete
MSNVHVIVTGGFDPIHSGHIAYLESARTLGDKLWVGLNSDDWLCRKKGQFFMESKERIKIISKFNMVDHAFFFNDDDNSACGAIEYVLSNIDSKDRIIFANGGDRTKGNIPEIDKFQTKENVSFKFGIGGDNKMNSSSWILENWKNPKTERKWGHYKVFDEREGVKVKELVIEPGSTLSDQRHFKRSEHWYVLEGVCKIALQKGDKKSEVQLNQHDSLVIEKGTWHRGFNDTDYICSILEVQYGEDCIEEDIERRA